jgi:hypothetical protein
VNPPGPQLGVVRKRAGNQRPAYFRKIGSLWFAPTTERICFFSALVEAKIGESCTDMASNPLCPICGGSFWALDMGPAPLEHPLNGGRQDITKMRLLHHGWYNCGFEDKGGGRGSRRSSTKNTQKKKKRNNHNNKHEHAHPTNFFILFDRLCQHSITRTIF